MNKNNDQEYQGMIDCRGEGGGEEILGGGQNQTIRNLRDKIKDKEQRTNTRIQQRTSIANNNKYKEQRHKPRARSRTKTNTFNKQNHKTKYKNQFK